MKKGASKRLKPEQLAELAALAALPNDVIDTSDAQEMLDWSGGKRGLFYRPRKQQLDSNESITAGVPAMASAKAGRSWRA
jgi:hypothetical protein